MRLPFLALALAVSPVSIPATAADRQGTEPARLWYSEQFTVHSKHVGRDFLIQVSRPANPVPGKTPALFLLDGNTLFPMAAALLGIDGSDGTFESAFVVGIAYDVATKGEWARQRTTDLRFAPVSGAEGAAFARFLTDELRPLIEARYRTDPHRAILAGHSFGGSFAAHMLLVQPGAFDAYLLGSPALWGEPDLLNRARSFVAPAPTKVFLSVGENEGPAGDDPRRWVANVRTLGQLLSRPEAKVDVKLEVVPGKTHVSVVPTMLEDGFGFLLPAKPTGR